MKTGDRYIFLLGGYDLEMVEIRKILELLGYQEGIGFFDKKLSWGASLSQYLEYLEEDETLVGIELVEDITPPSNYIRIDHHNEWAHLPASIEQVATLLGIQLTRDQLLVAANDRGYIPAMKAMGASQEEIEDIRRRDRASQGATEEDEQLAELSIQQATWEGDIFLVKSLTKKFSTITDRLFGKADRLLIFTDEEFTYYGTEKDKRLLVSIFQKEISANNMYSGGQNGGFVGAGTGIYSPENLTLLRNKLINSLKKA